MSGKRKAVLAEAVRRAIELAPSSDRHLARASGVHQTTIRSIRVGESNTTPPTATKIADALEEWAARCAEGAVGIRRALPRTHKPRKEKAT